MRKSSFRVGEWMRHKVEIAATECAMASVYFFISLLHLLPLWGRFMLFFQCNCKVYVQLWEWTQPSQVSKLNCLLPSLPQHATTFAANILFVTTVLSSPLTAASSPVVHALVFLLFLPCCGNFVLLAVAAVPSGHTHQYQPEISLQKHSTNSPSPPSSSSFSTVMWGHSWGALWFDSSVFMW